MGHKGDIMINKETHIVSLYNLAIALRLFGDFGNCMVFEKTTKGRQRGERGNKNEIF